METNPIEGNKLIAEFMGIKKMGTSLYYVPEHELLQRIRYSNECEEVSLFDERELKYHNSWDWLMPVINRISEESAKKQKDDCIQLWMFLINDINSVYTKVVEFIEWYNQNK